MKPIRVIIADDHAIVREGLRTLIEHSDAIELIGEASNGLEAVSMTRDLKPDVLVMDLVMPKMDGLEAINEIKKSMPDIRILVLTSFTDREKVVQAIKAGANGYLLKDSSPQQLLQAVLDIHEGESVLPPSVAARLIEDANDFQKGSALSEREREILHLLTQGLTDQEIAVQLNLSEWTVRTHVRHLFTKLGVENRTQAAVFALRSGLVKL